VCSSQGLPEFVYYAVFPNIFLGSCAIQLNTKHRKHWDYFPSLCLVTQDLVDEVKDMLAYVTCGQ